MCWKRFAVLLVLPLPFLDPVAAGDHPAKEKPPAETGPAPLLEGLGTHHHPVTTRSKEAQRYFDQGLTLAYAFNHDEAIRSFREAAKLDPECAMAYWGVALAHGMNINAPMAEEAVPKAHEAIQKARALAPKASAKEQAYIAALAERYTAKPQKDRAPLDRAYADQMRLLAKAYPDDLDAATLFAEALMNTMPWDYWTPEGKPKPATEEVLAALESVLQRNPNHPGANHYYIHAVEASPHPERGLAAAHRLGGLVPGAGHLVHMPSHIYLRVGDYHAASRANQKAIAVDEAYLAKYKIGGLYAMIYYPHNIHFLWYSAGMEGRCRDSLEAARKLGRLLAKANHEEMIVMVGWMRSVPLHGLVRFGKWEEVLGQPEPSCDSVLEVAQWHFARGIALARTGRMPEAEKELEALKKIAEDKETDKLELKDIPGASIVRIASTVLSAELAGVKGDAEAQVRLLRDAVRKEDALPYMEPPFWYVPNRHALGAVLLRRGTFAEAEAVYRDDLRKWPNNGWSLFGLLQCLHLQGKDIEAAEVERRFQEAWKFADVTLTASRF